VGVFTGDTSAISHRPKKQKFQVGSFFYVGIPWPKETESQSSESTTMEALGSWKGSHAKNSVESVG
jgi:hypothetical protein